MISSASSRVKARSVSVCSAPWRASCVEHLDDVVTAERHPDADQLAADLLDLALAVFDSVAPRRQAGSSLRRPAHERDVVRHARIFPGCD
jgi:hypothetical protein